MSERVKALTVMLENDLCIEDAMELGQSIQGFRGVLRVTPSVADFDDDLALSRAKLQLKAQLFEVLR